MLSFLSGVVFIPQAHLQVVGVAAHVDIVLVGVVQTLLLLPHLVFQLVQSVGADLVQAGQGLYQPALEEDVYKRQVLRSRWARPVAWMRAISAQRRPISSSPEGTKGMGSTGICRASS